MTVHATPVDWDAFADKLNEKGQGRAPLVRKSSLGLIGFLLEMRPYEDIEADGVWLDASQNGDEGTHAFLRFQPLDQMPEYDAARPCRLSFSFDEGETWQTFEEVMA